MTKHTDKQLKKLYAIACKLPAGLLDRLVLDAEFFLNWTIGKRKMRGYGRMIQFERWQEKAEDKRWKDIKSGYGGE